MSKYTPSEQLDSDLAAMHYNAARRFFSVTSDNEIKESTEELYEKFPIAMKMINQRLDNDEKALGEEKYKFFKKIIDSFDIDEFKKIVELAVKDHKANYGVSKISTWERV